MSAPARSGLLLTGAAVLTMDPAQPAAEAVGVVGDRIVAVGTAGEVRAQLPAGAEVAKLDGTALLPGFIDAHHHYCQAAFDRGSADLRLPPGSRVADVLALIESAVQEAPGTSWIRVQGYEPSKLRERRAPTVQELDEVCPHRPLLAIAYSFHDGCLNSRGLAEMGWDGASPDPPGGWIVRGRDGRPTGEVIEAALFLAEAHSRESLLPDAHDAWMAECEAHGRALLAAGITRVGDAAVPPSFEVLYERAVADGRLPVTVHRLPVSTRSFIEPRFVGEPTGAGPEGAPVGAAKLFLDGADRCAMCFSLTQAARTGMRILARAISGGGLATLRAANSSLDLRRGRDGLLHQGVLFWDQARLDAAVATAAGRGFQVAQHALGNEALASALAAVERNGATLAALPGRPRLEHAIFADPALVDRMAAVGAVPVVQPYFVYDFLGDVLTDVPPPRPLRGLPLRTMLGAGVELAGSSDYPVSGYDVLAAVRAAVTRRTRQGRVFQADEAIGVTEALRAYTAGSALALGVEDEAGTIAPGKVADLVVLSADPRGVDPERLTDISILRTYVGGRVAHSAA